MGKTRAAYPPEFRRQMVELVRAGRSPEELAREFEPTAQSIRNWLAQSERNAGRGDGGLTTAEREELNRLRRENRQLRLEIPPCGFYPGDFFYAQLDGTRPGLPIAIAVAVAMVDPGSFVAAASPTPSWDAEARIRLEVCGIMSLEWNAFPSVSVPDPRCGGICHELRKWNEPGFVCCLLDGAHCAAC